MIEIRQTVVYARWFNSLRDRKARARIDVRIRRLSLGNAGDVKAVGEGVSELRIDYGPGYRVYYTQRGQRLIVLLAGGNNTTQKQDIKRALEILLLSRLVAVTSMRPMSVAVRLIITRPPLFFNEKHQ